jgi:hypothetical protein
MILGCYNASTFVPSYLREIQERSSVSSILFFCATRRSSVTYELTNLVNLSPTYGNKALSLSVPMSKHTSDVHAAVFTEVVYVFSSVRRKHSHEESVHLPIFADHGARRL